MFKLYVPIGKLSVAADDQASAERRRALRDSLMKGDSVSVTNSGEMKPTNEVNSSDGASCVVPPGKLAIRQLLAFN